MILRGASPSATQRRLRFDMATLDAAKRRACSWRGFIIDQTPGDCATFVGWMGSLPIAGAHVLRRAHAACGKGVRRGLGQAFGHASGRALHSLAARPPAVVPGELCGQFRPAYCVAK
ncbi:hypothetical protein BN2476_740045 [Paraburkholderia piptadeniae]|uniref:Uncharacterized protein n=1 Tax=Paraburkholderia piptadeniae TaxID=1701573 RepID=A0A1N7SRN7_9BURK|nr:hypothetical protein BN2476_740045 [Paraburkholderia piptadeniae]